VVDDREMVRRFLDEQARAKNYPMCEVPAYIGWSNRKLAEGESEAFIANLDARGMWLLPEELNAVTESVFEELLSDLKEEIAKLERRYAARRGEISS
jgi:hypothetical protein